MTSPELEDLGLLEPTTLGDLGLLEPATLAQYADALVAMLEDQYDAVRRQALVTLGKLEPATLAQHAGAVVARLEDCDWHVRREALATLRWLNPVTLAEHADAVVPRLEDSDGTVRCQALYTLGKLHPASLAQYGDAVAASAVAATLDRLQYVEACREPYWDAENALRESALNTLRKLDKETLARYAGSVALQLDEAFDASVVRSALHTLDMLDPAALALYADDVAEHVLEWGLDDDDIEYLDDAETSSDINMRCAGLVTLGKLEPATLAQHAGAVAARLEDAHCIVRMMAMKILAKLEPATLALYAHNVLARLEDCDEFGFLSSFRLDVCAVDTLRMLPRFVTCDVDWTAGSEDLRSRLLGRLGWYRYRLRLRVQRLALYWYALPYRPSGPGHARDVEAWDQMNKRSRLV